LKTAAFGVDGISGSISIRLVGALEEFVARAGEAG